MVGVVGEQVDRHVKGYCEEAIFIKSFRKK